VIAFLCKFVWSWRLWLSPTMLGVLAIYLGGGPLLVLLALRFAPLGFTVPGAALAGTAALVVLGIALVAGFHRSDAMWTHPSVVQINGELHRLAIIGIALMITTAPVLLPLAIDGSGFGGFPHRVGDEVGPGFGGLWTWAHKGLILDFAGKDGGTRLPILTYAVPIVLGWTIWRPSQAARWLWPPAILYALWLGIGPHAGKVGDDLLPAVRALGAMQTVIGLGIGAAAVSLGTWLWEAPWDRWFHTSYWVARGKPGPGTRRRFAHALRHPHRARGARRIADRVHRLSREPGATHARTHAPGLRGRAHRDDADQHAARQLSAGPSPTGTRCREPLVEQHAIHLRSRPHHVADGWRWFASESELRRTVDDARLREERVDLRCALHHVRAQPRRGAARR